MNTLARILHLEDDPADVRLVQDALRDEGLCAQITVVADRPAFLAALDRGGFDLILADYKLPGFDGLQALALWRARWPDKPFLFVTGSVGEELAVESLRSGAIDHILKENLVRLVPAIRRAVAQAQEHARRQQAEEDLRQSEARFRALFENMQDGFAHCQMVFDDEGRPVDFIYLHVNSAFRRLTGLENVVGKRVTEVLPGIREAHPELLETYARVMRTGRSERFEIEFKPLAIWLTIAVYSPQPGHFAAVFDNITARKRAEAALENHRQHLEKMVQERTVELTRHREHLEELVKERSGQLAETNAQLEKQAAELRATNEELARFNRAMVDRELRMIELKKQINELSARLGQPAPYPLEFEK